MDVDLAVALDLEDFPRFTRELQTQGWTRDPRKEHRWYGPRGSTVDLLPAGPALRASKRLVWPESELVMSLVGFEHVFAMALPAFGEGARYGVASLPVLALLKIIAFMDDPYGRGKDLLDLRTLFRAYEKDSDRIFDDDVFDADLEDVEYANAYLLGKDVGSLVSGEEMNIVSAFLRRELLPDDEFSELNQEVNFAVLRVQHALRAFQKGLNYSTPGNPVT